MNLRILMALLLAACMTASAADKVTMMVKNSLTSARSGEMVEVSYEKVKAKLNSETVVVTDADGKEIPSQVTYDGKLIFQASVAAKGKSVYYAKAGTPSTYESKVYGRKYPERIDDFAWENDRVAYRAYGPASQNKNDRVYGYDIFNKRTSKLMLEEWYASQNDLKMWQVYNKLRKMGKGDLADDVYNEYSYHVDHGYGMDCYKVGSTLGAGAPALINGEDIVYPYCYKEYEILDKGPLRFTVRLVFGQSKYGEQTVKETRVITLDAGSQMNKSVVTYDGLTASAPVAAGIVVHNENKTAYVLSAKSGYVGYEDLGDPTTYLQKYREKQNKDFGKIFIGLVFKDNISEAKYKAGEKLPGACGHVLGIGTYKPGTQFTYYFGSGWNRNPETNFASLADWESYLSTFAKQVKTPLTVTLK